MGREVLYKSEEVPCFSPDEPWTPARVGEHFYNAQADFAIERLKGPGKCLVIGSPVFEAVELSNSWDVTYLDVRKPPEEIRKFIIADATDMPLEDCSFDAVSSTCVLCHAGLGRYGDPLVEDGDMKMLLEIARVLRPGGFAALTFGPVSSLEEFIKIGTCHRVYTMKEAARMAGEAGLNVVEAKVYACEGAWLDKVPPSYVVGTHYLSMLLQK